MTVPTNAQITTAIGDAKSLAITPDDMVLLLDRAIASAHVSGLAVVSYTIGGRSRTIGLTEARDLRTYYAGLAGGGGVLFQGLEFSE